MKYTVLLPQRCNLACDYCYVGKRDATMPISIAEKAIAFAFEHTPVEEEIQIGFFGGEPLLEFPLIKTINSRIEQHPKYETHRLKLGLATNGTRLTPEMLEFFQRHRIAPSFRVTLLAGALDSKHHAWRRWCGIPFFSRSAVT